MGRILTPPPRDERKQADVYGSRRVASHLASHLRWTPRAMVCAMVLPRTSRDQAAPAIKRATERAAVSPLVHAVYGAQLKRARQDSNLREEASPHPTPSLLLFVLSGHVLSHCAG